MSLKPQPPRPMPPELAAWGANHLADDDPYKLVGDTLYEQYHDEDFADLYHKEGQPALSPVLLSFVTVFQAFDNLPDRKAAEALEVNLKWKYALHLPLDAGSFDSSVLCEFRKRLLDHSAEARLRPGADATDRPGPDQNTRHPAHRQPGAVQPCPQARPA